MQGVQDIINEMQIFKKYFTDVRIVDPLYKKVLKVRDVNGEKILEEEKNKSCYDFWEDCQSCFNCISMRAINENESFVKFEEVGKKIFMITAAPVKIAGRILALELLKDITNQKIVDGIFNLEVKNIDAMSLHSYIARLNEMVIRDTLTRLYNREYINEKLPADIFKSYREKECLSVIMVDIDYFKKVNDNYGHVVGDEVLQKFAETLQKNIRQDNGDWVARYGGEEFLICLINCCKESALNTTERIRQTVEAEQYQTTAGIINITASFGIQTIVNEKMDMIELIGQADKNLYAAKQSGRNRVVVD